MKDYKCIWLWQPWASLCCIASPDKAVPVKPYETRHWPTNYRGLLLIHAAQKWNDELETLCWGEPFKSALGSIPGYHNISRGCIVGAVELVECWQAVGTNPIGTFILRAG